MVTTSRTKSLQEQSAKSSYDGSRGMKRKAEPNGGEEALSKKKLKIDQDQSCGAMQNARKDEYVALQQQHPVTRMETRPLEVGGQVVHSNTVTAPRRRLDGPDDGFSKQKAHPTTEKMLPDLIMPIKEKNSSLPTENYVELCNKKRAPRTTTASSVQDQGRTMPQVATASKQSIWQATTMKGTSKKFPTYEDSGSALYGDMVHFLAGIGVVPARCYDFYQLDLNDPDRMLCAFVLLALIFGAIMALFAISFKNIWFSRLAMLGTLTLCVVSNVLVDWPHKGECTVTSLILGGMLFSVMANLSLRFEEKITRLLIFFLVGSFASIQNPYSVYIEDTLPLLGGATLMSICVLYIYHFGVVSSSQYARLILGVLMVRHAIISATSSDYTMNENIMSIVGGAVLASVGIAAAGIFEDETLHMERLEKLVQKRTQKLHMVNLALQASETAIAITDNSGCIIWVNAAFERLSGKGEESLLGLVLKNVITNLDTSRKENTYLLMKSYDDPSNVSEREIKILDFVFHLESTPFSSESYRKDKTVLNDRFLMVFKDITATRARDIAEKKAQQEAMLAKAMSESMVTLTHELRTPLQGIMGVTSLLLQQANGLTNDVVDSLKLIMASSTLLLNLINNLLDVKKENAKSKLE